MEQSSHHHRTVRHQLGAIMHGGVHAAESVLEVVLGQRRPERITEQEGMSASSLGASRAVCATRTSVIASFWRSRMRARGRGHRCACLGGGNGGDELGVHDDIGPYSSDSASYPPHVMSRRPAWSMSR
jgi:hypothetical protein